MPIVLSIREFLLETAPALDVRSPAEFSQGHIPGSLSFPLFNDYERSQVGTVYKKKGREEAIELGLELVLPRIESMLEQASTLLTSTGKVLCWRGGMRSGSIARLLEASGFHICTLQGGYKAYRHWVLQRLQALAADQPLKIFILGGLTGNGKTALLHALQKRGNK